MNADDIPIACSLDAGDHAARGRAWHDLRRAALRSATQDGTTFTTTWRGEARDELSALVEAERICCPFFEFALEELEDGDLLLRATVPPGGEPIAEALFA